MRATLRLSPDQQLPLRALFLYMLFMGSAWAALHFTAGTTLGLLLGPIVAQAMMALVIVAGSRFAVRSGPAIERTAPRRHIQSTSLVIIALGGFLFQVTVLAGARALTAATIPGVKPGLEAPLMWGVLLITSVVGAPLLEERFFRGMLQPMLSRRNVALGLIVTAALFGLAHGFQTPFRAIPAFLQGLVLGSVVLLTGRLRAAIVVHALNNALVMGATLVLMMQPQALQGTGSAGSTWSIPVYGGVALGLLGWGFYRMASAPRLAAS